jgi:CubicO group peptidase (beta-lactamase class C family)
MLKASNFRFIYTLFFALLFFTNSFALQITYKKTSETLFGIDSIVTDAIAKRVFPGCQVLVLKAGISIYNKSFGNQTYEIGHPVDSTTMYDLASLSKSTGTLFAIMKLYDTGKLQLTDKASKYLGFLKNTDKENITITDLLFHETGLPAYVSFGRKPVYLSQLEVNKSAMQTIARVPLRPKTYLYSCVNFILLKEIAETISGSSLDQFLNFAFYLPMKLQYMAYLPLQTHKIDNIAPTLKGESFQNGVLRGIVHDPLAAYLGGVSGNAGLFANATDVAKMYQLLLNKGELDGIRYLISFFHDTNLTCLTYSTSNNASSNPRFTLFGPR